MTKQNTSDNIRSLEFENADQAVSHLLSKIEKSDNDISIHDSNITMWKSGDGWNPHLKIVCKDESELWSLYRYVMENQRIVQNINHRIQFLKDFIDSGSSVKPETRKLLEELECVRDGRK